MTTLKRFIVNATKLEIKIFAKIKTKKGFPRFFGK